jgi:gas vesicle protein
MFTRKQSFVSLAWVFAVGVVAGAAAALLYAPMTGRKMQKKVAGVTDKVIDKVDDIKSAVLKVANG